MTESETGVMGPQAKGCQGLWAMLEAESGRPCEALILDFWYPELCEKVSAVLHHTGCGDLLQQPLETNTSSPTIF